MEKFFKFLVFASLFLLIFKIIAHYANFNIPAVIEYIHLPIMLLYSFIALREVYTSKALSKAEKIMWTIGFIGIINIVAAMVYIFLARRRVLKAYRQPIAKV